MKKLINNSLAIMTCGCMSMATMQGQQVKNGAFDDTNKSFKAASPPVPAPQSQLAPDWQAPQPNPTSNLNSPDWDVVPGTAVFGYTAQVPASSNGGHWMGLMGFDWSPSGESIVQSVSGFIPGRQYQLLFEQIALPANSNKPLLNSGAQNDDGFLEVTIFGKTFHTPIETGDSNQWRKIRLNFTANTPQSQLQFLALDSHRGNGYVSYLGIDGVELRAMDDTEIASCIDFTGLKPGSQYGVTSTIHLNTGHEIQVHDYEYPDGSVSSSGHLRIDNHVQNSNETWIQANNANAVLNLNPPAHHMTFQYIDLGGNVNLMINGARMKAEDMSQFHNISNQSVRIKVTTHPFPGGHAGTVTLQGTIHEVGNGGQEFWFKSLCGE